MDIVTVTENGLYCAASGFYIDPWRPVACAVLTHAHGDHARAGSERYFAAEPGAGLLRQRLGLDTSLIEKAYGEPFEIGATRLSFLPAGHVLGSAQIRIETESGVWIVTGDYKRASDPTCAAFEASCCDETIYLHGAVAPLVEEYRRRGISMLPTAPVVRERKADYAGALIIAPPSAAGTPWMRRFPEVSTGFCSGWMRIRGARRRRGYDRGFILSDHADWPALLQTIRESGASRVLLTHGYTHALERFLREQGVNAAALRTAYGDEE